MSTTESKLIVGSLEICNLPDIGIFDLQIRVDTGAKTSSLHVDNLSKYKKDGKPWVKFDMHPDVYNVDEVITCKSKLHDIRVIKSSNGVAEERYVIKTTFQLSDQSWPIEITLTNRADMRNLMLLGREGMKNRILVDPSKTFLLGASN
ncbi:MAG: ATP-dependent zinc protease [Cellvibrionaceae bacterium]